MDNKLDYGELIENLKLHYSQYNLLQLSKIFNNAIHRTSTDMENNSYLLAPVRILVSTSIILIGDCFNRIEKNNLQNDYSDISSKILNNEINYFIDQVIKIRGSLTSMSFLERDDKDESIKYDLIYNHQMFNLPTIGMGEFIDFFKHNQKKTKSIYGFDFYGKNLYLLLILVNCISINPPMMDDVFPYAHVDSNNYNFVDFNDFLDTLAKVFDIDIESLNHIKENLLIDFDEIKECLTKDVVYPEDVYKLMSGYLGIKFKDEAYFIPKSHFMFKSIVDKIIVNSKKYGHSFENIVMHNLKCSLPSSDDNKYFQSYYIKGKDSLEQDILIKLNNKILIVECKTNIFKNVSREIYIKKNNQIIGKGIDQAQRVEKHIKNDNGQFVDKYGHDLFKVNSDCEIFKIIVTFNEFSQMAIHPEKYFELNGDYKHNLLVIDYFKLNVILWKCKTLGINVLFDYIKQRNDKSQVTETDDELDWFAFYLKNEDDNNVFKNADKVLLSDQSDDMYDEYDRENNHIELQKLEKYIKKDYSD